MDSAAKSAAKKLQKTCGPVSREQRFFIGEVCSINLVMEFTRLCSEYMYTKGEQQAHDCTSM